MVDKGFAWFLLKLVFWLENLLQVAERNQIILYSEYIKTGQIDESKLTKLKSCDLLENN